MSRRTAPAVIAEPEIRLWPWTLAAVAGIAAFFAFDDPLQQRTAALCAAVLLLWLTEAVALFVPTLILLGGGAVLLSGFGPQYSLQSLLERATDPVHALFFGGFVLSAAAVRYRIDVFLARWVLHLSGGRRGLLVIGVTLLTAVLSMWMSNVAAAAMMLTALRALYQDEREPLAFRRALLLGLAMGANLGGIASPIGTGPNAIAIASIAETSRVTFLGWMSFAVPLALLSLGACLVFLLWHHRVSGRIEGEQPLLAPPSAKALQVMSLFGMSVGAWLSEPFHGIPAAVIALAIPVVFFGSGLLGVKDLNLIDWSTLILIGGGVLLGQLLQQSGIVAKFSDAITTLTDSPWVLRIALVLAAAALSAVMSNTATSTMLIPLALSLDPSPAVAVLVAIGCSFGLPFVISTPPNAMVVGERLVRGPDLMKVGLPLMVVGATVVALTGPFVLGLFGLR